jgi:Lrp/AsnC family transcriptional regulator, leucine-responsive regulatory protein
VESRKVVQFGYKRLLIAVSVEQYALPPSSYPPVLTRKGSQMPHRPREVDQLSLRILKRLLANANMSQREIGKEMGIAASTVGRKIDEMLAAKTITRFSCELNADRLYEGTMIFAKIKLRHHSMPDTKDFIARISVFPEVLEVYSITDSGDYIVKVLAPSNATYGEFVDEIIRTLLGFEHVDSVVVLKQLLQRMPEPWRAFPYKEEAADAASGPAGAVAGATKYSRTRKSHATKPGKLPKRSTPLRATR